MKRIHKQDVTIELYYHFYASFYRKRYLPKKRNLFLLKCRKEESTSNHAWHIHALANFQRNHGIWLDLLVSFHIFRASAQH